MGAEPGKSMPMPSTVPARLKPSCGGCLITRQALQSQAWRGFGGLQTGLSPTQPTEAGVKFICCKSWVCCHTDAAQGRP